MIIFCKLLESILNFIVMNQSCQKKTNYKSLDSNFFIKKNAKELKQMLIIQGLKMLM